MPEPIMLPMTRAMAIPKPIRAVPRAAAAVMTGDGTIACMPGYGSRFWADRTADNRRRSHAKFRGDTSADAVVIGGGVTGCAAAYALSTAGLDVVLVDAERLAGGATSGAIGAILPQPDAQFLPSERDAGMRAARAGWHEGRRSAREFAAVLSKLPNKCDLSESHLYINAPTAVDALLLKREQAGRRKAGVEAPWLNAAAATQALNTDSAGAIRLKDAYEYDPVRAALALAGAAAANGARIFEHSAVSRTTFT